jgi:hypothetical protein
MWLACLDNTQILPPGFGRGLWATQSLDHPLPPIYSCPPP